MVLKLRLKSHILVQSTLKLSPTQLILAFLFKNVMHVEALTYFEQSYTTLRNYFGVLKSNFGHFEGLLCGLVLGPVKVFFG